MTNTTVDIGVHDVNVTGTIPTGFTPAAYVFSTDELERKVYGVIAYKNNGLNAAGIDEVVTIKFSLTTGEFIFNSQYLWEYTEPQAGMNKAQEAFIQFMLIIYNSSARNTLEDNNYYSVHSTNDVLVRACIFNTDTELLITYIGEGTNLIADTYIRIERETDSLFCIAGGNDQPNYYFLEGFTPTFSSNCAGVTVTSKIFKYTPNNEVLQVRYYIQDGLNWELVETVDLPSSSGGDVFISSSLITEVGGNPLSPNTIYDIKIELEITGFDIESQEIETSTTGNTSIDLLYSYAAVDETVTIYYERNIGGNDESLQNTFRIRVWDDVGSVWQAWQQVSKVGIAAQSHIFTGIDFDKFEIELIFNSNLGCSFTLTDSNEGCNASANNIVVTNYIELENTTIVNGGGSITFTASNSYSANVEARLQNLTTNTETAWVTVAVNTTHTWNNLTSGEYIIHVRDTGDNTCVNSSVVLTILHYYRATRSFTATCPNGFVGEAFESIQTFDSLISTADAIANALSAAETDAQSSVVCNFDLTRFVDLDNDDTAELFVNDSFTLSYTFDDNGHWVSFHSYIPDYYVNSRVRLFNFKDGKVFENNKGIRGKYYTDEIFPFIIEPVFSGSDEGMQYLDKTFYNINWNSDLKDSLGDFLTSTFTNIRVRTQNIDTTEKAIQVYENLTNLSANTRRIKSKWNFNDIRDSNALIYRQTRGIGTYVLIDLIFWNNQNKSLYLFDIDADYSLVSR